MKLSILLGLILLLNVNSYGSESYNSTRELKAKPTTTKKVKYWTKTVWSIIDTAASENYSLFFPHNQSQEPGYSIEERDFIKSKLAEQKVSMKENLWNIFRYHFFKSELTLYFATNPDWMDYKDEGQLLFPFTAEKYGGSPTGNYFNDSLFHRNTMYEELIGYEVFNPNPENIESIEYPGEDSIDTDGNRVYYANEFNFYNDKDILKYKIREEWKMNEAGEIISKKTKAICPMANRYASYKKEFVQKETYWIDLGAIKDILSTYYIQLPNSNSKGKQKIYSLEEYFDQRLFKSTIIKEEANHVKP
ncbi:MAG: hypothetical protein ACI857_002427, partial [Arenicella sp.]